MKVSLEIVLAFFVKHFEWFHTFCIHMITQDNFRAVLAPLFLVFVDMGENAFLSCTFIQIAWVNVSKSELYGIHLLMY